MEYPYLQSETIIKDHDNSFDLDFKFHLKRWTQKIDEMQLEQDASASMDIRGNMIC